MRTTLTLDDDVAARLDEEVRRSGQPFKVVVNEALRLGMDLRRPDRQGIQFTWRDLGFESGIQFESTSELLERLEGSGTE
ncbi:MAG: ribbon-helix-helix protein, CopG family [Bryobacteraceae bacterium]